MLSRPVHYKHPFPYFSADPAFSADQCGVLEQLFASGSEWQHQNEAFYSCASSDVTHALPAAFQSDVLARMRTITGLPLTDRVLVTAQQMLAGQEIGVHSDRPFLGYEMARLIVQLNKDWQAAHGGVLELFESQEGQAVAHVKPEYNTALGFLLHPHSYHAVTAVTRLRRTVVFNFWHKANTPELATQLEALFAALSFSEFPAALDDIASAAEESLPEEITFRAGTAAIALRRWGYDDATIVKGYRYSAGLTGSDFPAKEMTDAETRSAVLLADWVARLYRDSFDLQLWTALQSRLAGSGVFPRLRPAWECCFPE